MSDPLSQAFARFFRYLPEPHLLLRPELTIAQANDAYLRATMTRAEQIVGRHVFDAFPDDPDDANATGVSNLRASLQRVIATGLPDAMPVQRYAVRRPAEHGGGFEERYWNALNVPLQDEAGGLLGIVHRVTDVTESVRAERRGQQAAEQLHAAERALHDSQERFDLAVRSSPLGAWDAQVPSMRVSCTEEAQRMLGLGDAPGPLHLSDLLDRIHPDDRGRVQAAVAAALDPRGSGAYREQYRVLPPGGGVRWIDALGAARFEGAGPGRRATRFTGVLRDVTEQRQLLEELREANRAKDEFLAMLAHELRNPLAPLTNAHRLLARAGTLEPPQQAALAMAERQARQLTRLVDDLLEVSRIARGRIALRREPLDVAAAVREAAEAASATVGQRGQRLALGLPAQPGRILADPARIAQVLGNLLDNASKFTPPGGAIRLEVDARADEVEIRVADDGVGIEPDKLRGVFDLFSQIDATLDRAQGGLGIGLNLVRRLVEMHGGSVAAASAGKGKGATFSVRLPRGD